MKRGIALFSIGFAFIFAKTGHSLPDSGVASRDVDSFYDLAIDYSQFPARVTDKDEVGNILKLKAETKNVKFFKAGDLVTFKVWTLPDRPFCEAHVRGVEESYFIVYVKNLNDCWPAREYFRRGNLLKMSSPILAKRIKEASFYRLVLLERRKDYLNQLNEKNNFLWTFDQQKIKVAIDFDKQINALKRRRQQAVSELVAEKKEASKLQSLLAKRLDETDRDLDFYRIERQEYIVDRWFMDRDLGLPVPRRPQKLKKLDERTGRWHQQEFFR